MCHSDILPNTLHLYLCTDNLWLNLAFFNAARTFAITAISLCKRINHCSVRLVSRYKKVCKAFVKYAYFASELIIQLRNNGGLYRPSDFRLFPNRLLLCAAGVRTALHCSFNAAGKSGYPVTQNR